MPSVPPPLPLACANGSSVRIGDKPLCSTANSASLDRSEDGVVKGYVQRDRAARRITMAWNLCRNLTDAQLEALAAAKIEIPVQGNDPS